MVAQAEFVHRQLGQPRKNFNLGSFKKNFAIIEESYINIEDQLMAISNQTQALNVLQTKRNETNERRLPVSKTNKKRNNKKKRVDDDIDFLDKLQGKIEIERQEELDNLKRQIETEK